MVARKKRRSLTKADRSARKAPDALRRDFTAGAGRMCAGVGI